MAKINDYCITATKAPRLNNSKGVQKIPFPILQEDIQIEGINDEYLNMYRAVINALEEHSFLDDACKAISKKYQVEFDTFNRRVTQIRKHLLDELARGISTKSNVDSIFVKSSKRRGNGYIPLHVRKLSLENIINSDDSTFIIPELIPEAPSFIGTQKHSKVYQDVLSYLLSGDSLLDAFKFASLKYKTSWETIQNWFYTVRNLLIEEIGVLYETGETTTPALECFVVNNFYKNTVIGKSVPSERTGKSKEILYPLVTGTQAVLGASSKHVEAYMRVMMRLQMGEYTGYALNNVSKELGVSISQMDSIVPKIKAILLDNLSETLSKVVIATSIEEDDEVIIMEEAPIFTSDNPSGESNGLLNLDSLQNMSVIDFMRDIIAERDYYMYRCKDLEEEIKLLSEEGKQ